TTDANATVTKDTAWSIVENNGRPLLLIDMDLRLAKAAEASAITESHVLQLAFAAFITHRAIERMIREQEFDHALARLMNLWSIGMDYHTFRNRQSASNLQLGSLFHFDETHAASRLQRKVVVVAKRGDGNT